MKIYTGTGDTGETGLYGGERVAKDDARVEAYGTLDEANAGLGMAVVALTAQGDAELAEIVTRLQSELFTLGSDLATPLSRETQAGKAVVPRIKPSHGVRLEKLIDKWDGTLEPLTNFVLPGGTNGAAVLHHTRAVIRRAERRVVTLYRAAPDEVNPETLRYMNRLADLLFVLARAANRRAAIPDIVWKRPNTTR